jgi:uncharacterized protein YndB with AHSA1/START domain
MFDPSNSIRLHRVFKAPAERLYRAFLEPEALAKWLPPGRCTLQVRELDARVGGALRMTFHVLGTSMEHHVDAHYLELVPNERIVYANPEEPGLPRETVTITLRTVSAGTELTYTQVAMPVDSPPDMCYLGWQESLEQLARLVEPEMPDNG